MSQPPQDEPLKPLAAGGDESTPVELEAEAAASAGASGRKILILAAVVALALLVVHLTPLRQYATDPDARAWKTAVQAAGWWGPLVYFAIATVLIAIGFPRLMFCMAAGTLFGFVMGSALGQFSSLFGSYATFVFARWGGREWVAHRIERNRHLRDLLRHPSLFSVFLVRQLPIAGIVPNLILGLTPVRHRVFLVGSFLGYLPSVVWVSLIGSGIGKATLAHALGQVTLAMLGLGAVSMVAWYVRKKLIASAR